MDLVELLKRPEGKTLEFKRDLSTPEGALKTIVAFANTAGGTLLVGVEDKSRHVRGVRDPLDLEERLANLISDASSPDSCRSSRSCRGVARRCWPCRCTPARAARTT
jgi:ATP-dependent DNA helicase RecG